jgi:hypothetical protein
MTKQELITMAKFYQNRAFANYEKSQLEIGNRRLWLESCGKHDAYSASIYYIKAAKMS